MTWTKVVHNLEGHPATDTLPPDRAKVEFLRVTTDTSLGYPGHWYLLTGEVRRYFVPFDENDPDESFYESAQISGPEGKTIYSDEPINDDMPTEEGIYWRLADVGESATVES